MLGETASRYVPKPAMSNTGGLEPNRHPVVTLSLHPPRASIGMDNADIFANVGLWPDSVQKSVYYALKEKFDV